jgi:crotonobetaine/carnitine-CoA ligase
VNTFYKGEFLRYQLADSGAKVLLVEADLLDRVEAVWSVLPELEKVLVVEAPGDLPSSGGKIFRFEDYRPAEGPVPRVTARESDLAVLFYTSGTTGPSKGCQIPHGYLYNDGQLHLETSARTQDELVFTPLPSFHIAVLGGAIMPTVILGSAVAIAKRFSVSGFWPEIERTGAKGSYLIGTMIHLVGNAADTEASLRCKGQLRFVQGEPFPPHMHELWQRRFGVEITGLNAYGLTEAALITSLPAGEPGKPGSAGKRNSSFDVRIVDDSDRDVPVGEVGEVICRPKRPDVMFTGYWRRPEATVAQTRNLWFHTGDLGRFDEDGFFFFVDRKKDYLRYHGENISSFEVEQAIRNHPEVSEVAVHAVPSEFSEDDVKVTAVRVPESKLNESDLFSWMIDYVPYFALPRYIEFREFLPKTPTERIQKHQLRDEGVTATTWDRVAAGVRPPRR